MPKATRTLLLGTVMLATGCGASLSPHMRPCYGPEWDVRAPDKARVIFVRPANGAFQHQFTLIDEHGYFLGDSSAGYLFMVIFDPGEHYVIAMTQGTEALRMTLAAGRTYYVELRPKLGVWTPQVSLLAVTRQSDLWASIPTYYARSTAALSDFAAGQVDLYGLGNQGPEAAQRGLRAFASYTPEAKAASTLSPEDGE